MLKHDRSALPPVRTGTLDRTIGRFILVCWLAAASLGLLSWTEPVWFMAWVEPGRMTEARDYKRLGDQALRRQQWEVAAGIYQLALKLHPEQTDTRGNLGIALLKLGRLNEAETLLLQCLRDNPANQEITALHLGTLNEMRGRRSAAVDWFLRSAHDAAYPAAALRQAGRLLLKEGRPAEALPLLERSLALESSLDGLLAGMLKCRLPADSLGGDSPLVQLSRRPLTPADLAPFAAWVPEWLATQSRDAARSHLLLSQAHAGLGQLAPARAASQQALACWPGWGEAVTWQRRLEASSPAPSVRP